MPSEASTILSTLPIIFLLVAGALFTVGAVGKNTLETRFRWAAAGWAVFMLYLVLMVIASLIK